jgi:hypothetical protein
MELRKEGWIGHDLHLHARSVCSGQKAVRGSQTGEDINNLVHATPREMTKNRRMTRFVFEIERNK